MEQKQERNQLNPIFVLLLSVVIIIVVLLFSWKNKKSNQLPSRQEQRQEEEINVKAAQEIVGLPPVPLSTDYLVGWNKYEEKEYGYKMYYPDGWRLVEMKSPPFLLALKKREGGPVPDLDGNIALIYDSNTSQLTLHDYINSLSRFKVSDAGLPITVYEDYEVKIESQIFIHRLESQEEGPKVLRWYTMNKKGEVFILHGTPDLREDDPKYGEQREEMLKIFSTFRFIE